MQLMLPVGCHPGKCWWWLRRPLCSRCYYFHLRSCCGRLKIEMAIRVRSQDLTGPRFCRTERETSCFRHTSRAATATTTTPVKKTAAIGSRAPARPPTEQGQSNTSLLLYVCLQSSEMISGNAVWFQSAGLHYKESLCSVCQPDLNQPVRTQPATTWAQLTLHSERWQCAHSRCTSAPRGRGLRHTFERTTVSPIYLPLKSDVVPLRCCQGIKRGQSTPPVCLPLSSASLIS